MKHAQLQEYIESIKMMKIQLAGRMLKNFLYSRRIAWIIYNMQ